MCGARFTTYEYVEERPIQVLKRSGAVEEFDRGKLLASIKIACAKRPVSGSEMERIVDEVEDDISRDAGLEVPQEIARAAQAGHVGDRSMPRDDPRVRGDVLEDPVEALHEPRGAEPARRARGGGVRCGR